MKLSAKFTAHDSLTHLPARGGPFILISKHEGYVGALDRNGVKRMFYYNQWDLREVED